MDALIEFIKILVPASVVLYAAYLLVRTFVAKEIEMKRMAIQEKTNETLLPMRLQAYERMVLFLERMAPQHLLLRLSDPARTAADFKALAISEIQNEYQHNITQQLYMSERVWTRIKDGKEELIAHIEEAALSMEKDATGADLAQRILQRLIDKKSEPLAPALSELKKEIQQVF